MDATIKETNESKKIRQIDECECYCQIYSDIKRSLFNLQYDILFLSESYSRAACLKSEVRNLLNPNKSNVEQLENAANIWKKDIVKILESLEKEAVLLLENIDKAKNCEGLNPCFFEEQGWKAYEE